MSKKHKKYPPGFNSQGVVNMDLPGWRYVLPGRAEKPGETDRVSDTEWEKTLERDVTDLLYTGDDFSSTVHREVSEAFPAVVFTKDWDIIHETRLGVEIPGTSRADWYKWLFKQGLAGISFMIQLDSMTHAEALLSLLRKWDSEEV